MTKIDTIEDLVRIIEEQPAWLDRIRNLILTDDLVRLPGRVDAMASNLTSLASDFGEFAQRTDQRLGSLEEGQGRMEERQGLMEGRQDRMEKSLHRLEKGQERLEKGQEVLVRRVGRLTDGVGELKGSNAIAAVERRYEAIAFELGYRSSQLLGVNELYRIASSPEVQHFGRDVLRSFRAADLLLKAEDDYGTQHYIVVEVSYTINGRDTQRAVRNAEILSIATGTDATAVVAGYSIDGAVREEIQSGSVRWFQLEARELTPR